MLIAELGINHLGNMALAKRMIREAKSAGADLVKGQLYNAEDDRDKLLYPAIKQAELTFIQAKELFDYAKSIDIEMFFSVFGIRYVEWCKRIGVQRYKLAASENQNFPLLLSIMEIGKPILQSIPNGLCLQSPRINYKTAHIEYLYCIPRYPCPPDMVRMQSIGPDIGFSDHCPGIDVAKIALARGARIIEKHFCLDRTTAPEGAWSITPDELRELKRWEFLCQSVLQ